MNQSNFKTLRNVRTQAGVTLVVSLIILVVLTLLGVTSMESTRTEVAMAGNLRESNLTFEAAEAGLRAAEAFIEATTSSTDFNDPANGLYAELDSDPDYDDELVWENNSQTAGTSIAYLDEQPQFIINYLGDRSQNVVAAVNIGGYGNSQPGLTVSNFRITARGTGQSGNFYRYLQTYYGKEY